MREGGSTLMWKTEGNPSGRGRRERRLLQLDASVARPEPDSGGPSGDSPCVFPLLQVSWHALYFKSHCMYILLRHSLPHATRVKTPSTECLNSHFAAKSNFCASSNPSLPLRVSLLPPAHSGVWIATRVPDGPSLIQAISRPVRAGYKHLRVFF